MWGGREGEWGETRAPHRRVRAGAPPHPPSGALRTFLIATYSPVSTIVAWNTTPNEPDPHTLSVISLRE